MNHLLKPRRPTALSLTGMILVTVFGGLALAGLLLINWLNSFWLPLSDTDRAAFNWRVYGVAAGAMLLFLAAWGLYYLNRQRLALSAALLACLTVGGDWVYLIRAMLPAAAAPLPEITFLPDRGILDYAVIPPELRFAFIVIDPASGALFRWRTPEAALTTTDEGGIGCEAISWSPTRQRLLVETRTGLSLVDRSGSVQAVPFLPLPGLDPSLGPLQGVSDCALSPDGTEIAYRIYTRDVQDRLVDDLFIQSVDGSPPRQITRGLRGERPSWSPDGQALVFLCYEVDAAGNATEATTIYRVQKDGTQPIALVRSNRGPNAVQWSPDGTHIGFLGKEAGARLVNLFVMKPDGSGRAPVLPLPPTHNEDSRGISAFAWSPDGKELVFLADWNGPCWERWPVGPECQGYLYVIQRDGTGLRQLTQRPQSLSPQLL